MDDMNIGTRIGGSQNPNQWKSYSLQRGTAPVGTEVSPPQIPSQQQQQQATPPNGQNAIYASTNFENADGTLVIRRQMLNRYFFSFLFASINTCNGTLKTFYGYLRLIALI
jgi:hypothetical protein